MSTSRIRKMAPKGAAGFTLPVVGETTGAARESRDIESFTVRRTDLNVSLTGKELERLSHCEQVLDRGLATFFEVGEALLTIREERLYRRTHHDFESYCRQKWGMGRSYAWRVIGAAERVKLLPNSESVPRPENEFQMRPFLKLDAKAFPKIWEEAIKRAKNGKVTASSVRALVAEASTSGGAHSSHKMRPKRTSLTKAPTGQILVLLHEAKGRIEKGEAEQALEALEKIECLLYGPHV